MKTLTEGLAKGLIEKLRQRTKPLRERLRKPVGEDLHEPYDALLNDAADAIENLVAYANHERSLGAEPFAIENQTLVQTIERLENEALAATIRIENDKLEIESLRAFEKSSIDTIKHLQYITDEQWKDREGPLKQAELYMSECNRLERERDKLAEELDKLKQQGPVAHRAWFDADNGDRWLFTLWPDEEKLDVVWEPLFLAAGASHERT